MGGQSGDNGFLARDCSSGRIAEYSSESGDLIKDSGSPGNDRSDSDVPYIGSGLVDLQINGVKGIDFNSCSLSEEGLISAAGYLLTRGITTFFPTVITNSVNNTRLILSVIDRACLASPLLNQCIGGIHLEGPFISRSDGYRGAHKKRYVRAPDRELFKSFQKASGGRIRIISLSPEWDNATDFIRKCKKEGLLVSIAHSAASAVQVIAAVKAGARLASHLGNAVPLMLPRHSNIIYEQLANEDLYASIVADGFHLPDSFIRVVIKTKRRKAILASDATCFAGMPPGVYKAHIGGDVVLGEDGSLRMKGGKGLLAGSAKLLTDNVQHLAGNDLTDLSLAWYMASAGPARLINLKRTTGYDNELDRVLFNFKNGKIFIYEVWKNGVSVWKSQRSAN